jgi:hypothetical protein
MTSANTMSILKSANWRDARWTHALRIWRGNAMAVIARLKALAPYALIELVLPGGSVMALLLWLYRRRKNGVGFGGFPSRAMCDDVIGLPLLAFDLSAANVTAPSGLRVRASPFAERCARPVGSPAQRW